MSLDKIKERAEASEKFIPYTSLGSDFKKLIAVAEAAKELHYIMKCDVSLYEEDHIQAFITLGDKLDELEKE